MSKDLTRRTDIAKSEQINTERTSGKTEVEHAKQALAERMIFGASPRLQDSGGPPRIILALDCTSAMGEFVETRNITREAASIIANSLFAEAGPAGLAVRLIFFRGDDKSSKKPRQLQVSDDWYTAPEKLARAIAGIQHWGGWTQHCGLLRHAIDLAEKLTVQQVVIISDSFERAMPRRPDGDDLTAALVHAARLRELGVKLVIGYKGTIRNACPLDRAGVNALQAFRDITDKNGYVFPCDPRGDLTQLGERFAEIAAQARLSAQGDAAGAQRLLEHVQTIPFEMTVGERVPSARCTSEREGSEE